MAFIGMKPRQDFMATKLIAGKFYCLSVKGKLYSWDLMTGKPIPVNIQKKELSQYEVYAWSEEDLTYKKEWFDKILLKKKVPIKIDEAEYFGHLRDHAIKG